MADVSIDYSSRMDTPCKNICVLDRARGLCTGCLRTLDEIARWSLLSDAERRRIMNELPSRTVTEPSPTEPRGTERQP